MKIKKNSIAMFFLIVLYLVFIISIFIPSFNNVLESYLMYIIFIICILFNAIYTKSINKKSALIIFPFIICFVLSLTMLISGFGSYLNVINLILIIVTAKKLNFSDKNYKTILYLCFFLLIALWIKSVSVWDNFVLNLDDNNPNVIAQEIVLAYGIICSGMDLIKKGKDSYFLLALVSIITFLSILQCNCRTALIVYIILVLSLLFKNIRSFINKKYIGIIIIIIICGLLFPFLYVFLYKNSYIINIPFVSEKSFFTGREMIWKIAIDALNNSGIKGYLLGLGSHYVTSYGIISNFHNWYLGMVYYFGIPLTFFFFSYFVYELSKIENITIKITVLSIFLFGFSETSALWAKSQIIIFALFIFINYGKKVIQNEKK